MKLSGLTNRAFCWAAKHGALIKSWKWLFHGKMENLAEQNSSLLAFGLFEEQMCIWRCMESICKATFSAFLQREGEPKREPFPKQSQGKFRWRRCTPEQNSRGCLIIHQNQRIKGIESLDRLIALQLGQALQLDRLNTSAGRDLNKYWHLVRWVIRRHHSSCQGIIFPF